MLISYISLIGGLVALIVAGDFLVRGAVSIAEKLGIPTLVIGLTIVAFGTSAPELFISLRAALDGFSGIAIGNVVGSNIANVLLVLGAPAIIATASCQEKGACRNAIFMVAVTVIFIGMCYFSPLSLIHGLVLLGLLALFLGDSVLATRRHKREKNSANPASANDDEEDNCDAMIEEVEGVPEKAGIAALFLAIGVIGLPLGAHFTIEGASLIARSWEVSDAVIGLTVIALGTSLPELATSIMAALRGHAAVALGNVIGSNIFNLLAIIGVTAIVTPINVPVEVLKLDVWVMLASAILVLIFATYNIVLKRLAGIALLLLYALYIASVFIIGTNA